MFICFLLYVPIIKSSPNPLIYPQVPLKRVEHIRQSTSFLYFVEVSVHELPLFVGWCLPSLPVAAQGHRCHPGISSHHCLWVFLHLSHTMGLLFPECSVLSFLGLCLYLGGAHPLVAFWKWLHGREIFELSITKNDFILPLFLIDNVAGCNLLDWKSYPLDYFVEDIECFQNFKCSLVLFLS